MTVIFVSGPYGGTDQRAFKPQEEGAAKHHNPVPGQTVTPKHIHA